MVLYHCCYCVEVNIKMQIKTSQLNVSLECKTKRICLQKKLLQQPQKALGEQSLFLVKTNLTLLNQSNLIRAGEIT